MINGPIPYLIMTVFLSVAIYLSKINLRLIFKGLRPILILLVFTTMLNIFYTQGGTVLLNIGFVTVTTHGIYMAFFIILRLILLISVSFVMLTYTTSPIMLTDGLESLLGPFKKLKFPAHELAMMMTIALRFIPTLMEETDRIMSAQKSRGADFETGSILKRAKALIPVLIPLFIGAFRRAEELAIAMECRCYRGGQGRTRLRVLVLDKKDYAVTILTLAVFAISIVMSYTIVWGVITR
jgi:energy-coupling factor transport system permease protein